MVTAAPYLEDNGIRVPSLEEALDPGRVHGPLDTLKAKGSSTTPLDVGMAWTRRVVSLCLLAPPAKLRRRPDRPLDITRAADAC